MCDIFNFLWNQGEHIFLWKEKQNFCIIPAGITCSKSTIEVLEQRIKYVQSQENHTREGGTHLRISFWHLLMNFEKNEKSEFWKNEKKIAGDIIIVHMCTKNHNHIIWGTVPEIWGETKIFGHFGPLFALYSFTPPNNPKNQNFEKMKEAPGDVIILNLCNKKHQMMYAY